MPLTDADLAAIEAAVESQVGPIYETAGVDLRLVPIEREPIFLPRQSVCALLADLRTAYSTIPVFIPLCCLRCRHYDAGEWGEYGEKLSYPYCMKNVFFPVRKGTCAKQEVCSSAAAVGE